MSDPNAAKTAPKTAAAAAPAPPEDAPKARPYAAVPSKAHVDALVARRDLGLDRSSASMLLALLLVEKGEKWLAEAKSPEVVETAAAFASRNPIAWRSILATNALGVVKGLELYGTEHVAPEEYVRIATHLEAAA